MFMIMFDDFMKANLIGLPLYLSLEKGKTANVSNATISNIHLIYSGLDGISRKEAIASLENHKTDVMSKVEINIELKAVL